MVGFRNARRLRTAAARAAQEGTRVTTTTERNRGLRPRIGIFGIGLAAYWPQFPGLKEQLAGYQRTVEERIGQWAEVVSAGLVDSGDRPTTSPGRGPYPPPH